MNENTIKDGDEEAWTRMFPGNCDISSFKAYRQKIMTAKPDSERTRRSKLALTKQRSVSSDSAVPLKRFGCSV